MPSKAFLERKEIYEIELQVAKQKHKIKMEEILAQRENDRLQHENELTRIRIKSAEIRKNQERKENLQFMNNYSNEGRKTHE